VLEAADADLVLTTPAVLHAKQDMSQALTMYLNVYKVWCGVVWWFAGDPVEAH
jgi:hypothetical protein